MNCCICQFSCTKGTNYELGEEASTICKKCTEKLTRYHKSIQIARRLRQEILELISSPFTTKSLRSVASKTDIQVDHIDDKFDDQGEICDAAEEEEYLDHETEAVETIVDTDTITEEEEGGEENSFILKDAILEEEGEGELHSVDLELDIDNEIIIDEEALEEGEMQLKEEADVADEIFKEETMSDFDDHLENTIEFLDSDVEDEQDQDSSGDYTVNIQCPSCPEKFGSRRGYNAHTKREHFPGYVCDQCGKTLQSYSGFIGHLQNHEPVKQFACPECPERFSRKFRLKHHMAWHTGETPYQCEVCSKRFVHKVALYKHKMIHDNETKRLECQVCGFKTRTKAHLERHMRSHTGDKPFACPMCNKRFSQMYNMKAHLREHESPGTNRHRRYHCPKCTHTFINEQNYVSHVERNDCTAV